MRGRRYLCGENLKHIINNKFRIVGVARRCWFIRLRHAVFMQTYVKQQYIVLNDLRDGEKGSIFVVQKQKQHIFKLHNSEIKLISFGITQKTSLWK